VFHQYFGAPTGRKWGHCTYVPRQQDAWYGRGTGVGVSAMKGLHQQPCQYSRASQAFRLCGTGWRLVIVLSAEIRADDACLSSSTVIPSVVGERVTAMDHPLLPHERACHGVAALRQAKEARCALTLAGNPSCGLRGLFPRMRCESDEEIFPPWNFAFINVVVGDPHDIRQMVRLIFKCQCAMWPGVTLVVHFDLCQSEIHWSRQGSRGLLLLGVGIGIADVFAELLWSNCTIGWIQGPFW
jgi:hypothetical protein